MYDTRKYFFSTDKELEKKKTGVECWEDRKSAIKDIRESQKRYENNRSIRR
jgi:inorganic pyrophosphatase